MKIWQEEIPLLNLELSSHVPDVTEYVVQGTKQRAAVLVLPGGGYSQRAQHEGEGYAKWLNTLGLNAFVVNYRVAPYRYPTALLDARRAVKFLRKNAEEFNIDPEKIIVIGSSAGGHLAANLSNQKEALEQEPKDEFYAIDAVPNAAILCYPVISLKGFGHVGSANNLLGDKVKEETLIEMLSQENCVSEKTPPTFLWHTITDPVVNIKNSLYYTQLLAEYNIPTELHVFPFGSHGLGLSENQPHIAQWSTLCENWLRYASMLV